MKNKILTCVVIGALAAVVLAGCSKSKPTPQSLAAPAPAVTAKPPVPSAAQPSTPAPVIPAPAPSQPPPDAPVPSQGELPLKISQPLDGSTLNSTSYSVRGQTKAGATVTVNDEIVIADSQGNFTVALDLDEGPNAIDVIATDDAGNQGEEILMVNVDLSRAFPAAPQSPVQSPAPAVNGVLTLKVTQPLDGANLSGTSVTVRGQTDAGATVSVNDEIVTADDQGNFSVPIDLDAGPNAILVVAMDDNGNENDVLLIVNAGG